MRAASRLGLGTVQFGLDYGISNRDGQTSGSEVRRILDLCMAESIDLLDTAHLYGESEGAVGRNWPPEADFRLVTKTPKFGACASAEAAVEKLEAGFQESLRKLRRTSLYGLLLHDAGDLLGPFGTSLWSAMERLQAEGLVAKIGLSVYDAEEIDAALERCEPHLLQLPYNALDDRLVRGGQLQKLDTAGIEIHARSIFLQGLLLQGPSEIPPHLSPLRGCIEDMDAIFARRGLSRLQGLVASAFQRGEISRFIVGVTNAEELRQIVAAAKAAPEAGDLRLPVYDGDPRYLNPALWPSLFEAHVQGRA